MGVVVIPRVTGCLVDIEDFVLLLKMPHYLFTEVLLQVKSMIVAQLRAYFVRLLPVSDPVASIPATNGAAAYFDI